MNLHDKKFSFVMSQRSPTQDEIETIFDIIFSYMDGDDVWVGTEQEISSEIEAEFSFHKASTYLKSGEAFVSVTGPIVNLEFTVTVTDEAIMFEV